MQRMEENREKISKFVDQKRRRGGKRTHKNATKVKKLDYGNLVSFPLSVKMILYVMYSFQYLLYLEEVLVCSASISLVEK